MTEANSSNCSHNCSTCSSNCADRTKESFLVENATGATIKKIIGVVSGKGGVGKSMVTGLAALAASRAGLQAGILDADITGPSIPQMFGLHEQLLLVNEGIEPAVTRDGLKVVSTNLVVENPEEPVVWRGPVIANMVKQFYTDTNWGNLDLLFVDMPPGTGDVPLTVFQSLPIDGIVIVTSPQELVSMIVGKALRMAELMEVPVLGIIENMSYVTCPHCGQAHQIFGDSHVEEISAKYHVPLLDKLPIDPILTQKADGGAMEDYQGDFLPAFGKAILKAIG